MFEGESIDAINRIRFKKMCRDVPSPTDRSAFAKLDGRNIQEFLESKESKIVTNEPKIGIVNLIKLSTSKQPRQEDSFSDDTTSAEHIQMLLQQQKVLYIPL